MPSESQDFEESTQATSRLRGFLRNRSFWVGDVSGWMNAYTTRFEWGARFHFECSLTLHNPIFGHGGNDD